MKKRILALVALAGLVTLHGCGPGGSEDGSVATSELSMAGSPLSDTAGAAGASGAPIPDRWIVVFRDEVAEPGPRANVLMQGTGGQIHFTYGRALKGFAATIPPARLSRILSDPDVLYVEQDQVVSLSSTVQSPATWGLDRVDQRPLPLNSSYQYTTAATGVTAYVIDTGIRRTHTEFATPSGSRVSAAGFTAFTDGHGTNDCNGHGTHVAGTVGGVTYGVAKGVALVPVRVLDCGGSGSWSGVIAGIDWVAKNANLPAVANMSLGGGASSSIDTAVDNLFRSGVTVVVAAGNSNADACRYSPARAPSAITVGATTRSDARANYSNFGKCLDLFAPGSAITSASIDSDTSTATFNGTSMASPHVAGVAALILAATSTATPADVTATIVGIATQGVVTSAGSGSPNRLAHSLVGSTVAAAAAQTVSVTHIAGSSKIYANRWTADATVTVTNEKGALVDGASVTGSFSGLTGTKSCTTSSGVCKITSNGINKSVPSTTFSVTGVAGTNMTYEANVTSLPISQK
jgi:aqualysin 1